MGIICGNWEGTMPKASRLPCWATGIVMVEPAAKTNSVTSSTGIKLVEFFCSSVCRAPPNYIIDRSDLKLRIEIRTDRFGGRAPIEYFRLYASVIAEVDLILKRVHDGCNPYILAASQLVAARIGGRRRQCRGREQCCWCGVLGV